MSNLLNDKCFAAIRQYHTMLSSLMEILLHGKRRHYQYLENNY